MKIATDLFAAAVVTASPALSSKAFVPLYTCFYFDGKRMTAHDGVVAIRVPLDTDFVGGVSGGVLCEWLKSLRSPEIDITQGGNELLFKCGKAKLSLPLIRETEFVFEPVEFAEDQSFVMPYGVATAVERCMVSVGTDPGEPWRVGILCELNEGSVSLFSTNSISISHTFVDATIPQKLWGTTLTMPEPFARQLLNFHDGSDSNRLHVTDGMLMIGLPNGIEIWTRTMREGDPSRIKEMIDSICTDNVLEGLVAIPEDFEDAMGRAQVLTSRVGRSSSMGKCRIEVVEYETAIRLYAKTSLGEVDEELELDATEFSLEPNSSLNPSDVIKALDTGCLKRMFLTRCAVFVSEEGDFIHLVSFISE